MADLPLTIGHYARPRLDLPAMRALNVFAEQTKGGPSKLVRTTRPGLTLNMTLGTGPILRSFQQPDAFGGDVFNISGAELYRGANAVAPIAFGSHPRFASAQQQLMIVSGGGLYEYTGTTLQQITTFDDGVTPLPPFSGAIVLYNIWCYPVVGSTQFFFSSPGNGAVINAANFSNAQTSPSAIVEMAVLAEELYIFKSGSSTAGGGGGTEIWDFTGQLTAPFAESQGRTYARGIAAQDSVCLLDNALFWVGDNFSVYRTGTVPQRVSSPWIEDRLRKEADAGDIGLVRSCTYAMEGHEHYIMNLPTLDESYALDAQSKEWFQWGTLTGAATDPGQFIAQTAAGQGEQIYLGSSIDGRVWQPDPENPTDDGVAIQRVVSGALWISGGVLLCRNVSLQCVRGVGTIADPNPLAWMRFSDDGGRTWSSWLSEPLGPAGGYRVKATWRGLGPIFQPGREFEFRCSDPVNWTIESATYNEARV